MASVRKRFPDDPKSPWVCDYVDQSGTRRLKTFKMKKLADAFRMKMEAEISEGIHTSDRESVTVAQAADAFIRDCERRHHIGDEMSGSSLAAYRGAVKVVKLRFGSMLVKNLTTIAVQAWVDELSVQRKRNTLHSRYRALRMILTFSVRKGWIKRSVLKDEPARLPALGNERVRIPTKADIVKVIDATRKEKKPGRHYNTVLVNRAIVLLGFHCGMRIGEIAGLQWENVDFTNDTVAVRHSHSREDGLKAPKSSAGNRDIPMSPDVRAALMDLWQYWTLRARVVKLDAGGYSKGKCTPKATFTRRRNQLERALAQPFSAHEVDEPLEGFVMRSIAANGRHGFEHYDPAGVANLQASNWHTIMSDAGLLDDDGKPLFSSHKMRHAAVSLMIESGLPALNLKTVIGHKNINTTMSVYAHLFPDDQRSKIAIEGIAAALDATRVRQNNVSI
ncbi:site-specific integrase [Shinella sp. DD12]|uniref:tyrosine-type recombinase/integrase n=1 Tax=Shinella sp. DD12 TaxID=1410620 RepID=UPI000437BD63|nr:site-specific integrase [Shinella sp. DD12]EYR81870.1 site-specific recombinase XerD [Shinella sp. DD12]